jgi:hypothetical protein
LHHRTTAISLLETAARLGVEYSPPVNPGPTYVSRANADIRSVIDLVFLPPPDVLASAPLRDELLGGESDHVPLITVIRLDHRVDKIKGRTLKPDSGAETMFCVYIIKKLPSLLETHQPDTPEGVEALSEAVMGVFSSAWNIYAEEYIVGPRSKKWWSEDCTKARDNWWEEDSAETRAEYCRTLKETKRKFFDDRIKDIAETKKRPWDLMDWVKERKNPPCEAIQFNGQPCHELPQLWDALHGTYNAANDRPVDTSILDDLPDEPVREWPVFSSLELRQALEACSAHSAPGPDHVTWTHLKLIMSEPECERVILTLANACIITGHWPKHFKDSLSVIIPKPGKESYDTPKSFRPIVLLNTLGKLVEKMISNRFQFDMIKHDLVDPNQMGGVRQRSTEDAGLFLTHLVRTGWASGLQTSVLAFDIAQFFPSINHEFLLAVLRKQGFHPMVVSFFESYLVERHTTYVWNNFTSDPRRADVGVGQGSALSPVLSALIMAPIMKLYRMRESIGSTLISYVDDGTVVVQAREIATNCIVLYHAYATLVVLCTAAGLAMEHSKTELFHFTRAHKGWDQSLDLGFAPFTGNTPLKPKKFWRYLGFFFDRRLTFQEHFRFYTTKSLTTVMAMRMLGNSARGLTPKNKRILYRACVMPIATYGHRLWYFEGAKNVGVLKSLTSMQRKAACWITGAFCTSPTGGTECLAGLPPIKLHLRKLSQQAVFRTATLSDTHPLRSLMPEEFRGGAKPHLGAACHLHRRRQGVVQDAISQTVRSLGKLMEDFEPCANEASPGSRMMDLYGAQVHFNQYDSYGEEPLKRRRTELNTLFNAVSVAPRTVCMGTDASVPKTTRHHATAAFVFEGLVDMQGSSIMMAGRVLASDAELFAIRAAVCKATGFVNCDRIVLFTDSIGMAKRAVDPSIHSGQAHSLAVCKALNTWLSVSPDRRVDFIETPSKLKWGIQHAAHLRARSLPPVLAGARPDTSLDSVRKEVTNSAIDSWATMSKKDEYLGHQFLILRDPKGKRLRPTYSNGGMWLRNVNEDNALCARFCRAILNHALTGEYYRRFNIPGHETHECECGCPMQSRHHIFTQCGVLETRDRLDVPTRAGRTGCWLLNATRLIFFRQHLYTELLLSGAWFRARPLIS